MARGSSSTTLVSTGGSNSLRTTVPMWIIEQFGLAAGDRVEWVLKVENDKMSISVTPQE
tara:strand:+ start:1023 stop:1199 length:177 start_codon:yes stop_codon:yes gene_type:complete